MARIAVSLKADRTLESFASIKAWTKMTSRQLPSIHSIRHRAIPGQEAAPYVIAGNAKQSP